MMRSRVFSVSRFTSLFSFLTLKARASLVILLLFVFSFTSPAFAGDLLELLHVLKRE